MKTVLVAVFGLLLGSSFPGANPASAADMPDVIPAYAPAWSWTGLYIGAHLGAGSASSQFSDPAGPPIYGGTVRSPAFLGGGQARKLGGAASQSEAGNLLRLGHFGGALDQ